jgi:hypothetical protein
MLEAMHYKRLLITQKTGIKNLRSFSTDWLAEVSFFLKRPSSRLTILYFAAGGGGCAIQQFAGLQIAYFMLAVLKLLKFGT